MSILFEKDISRKKIEERYKKYGLSKNPFPLAGNFPEGYLQYTYLDPTDIVKLEDFLRSTFEREEFNGLIILGEFGSGKSHILNLLHETIEVDENVVFQGQAKSFIIQNPGVDPQDILLSMLREVKLSTLQDLIFLPIQRKLHERYGEDSLSFLDSFTDYNRNMKLGEKWQPEWYKTLFSLGYREFNQRLDEQNIHLKIKDIQPFARDVLQSEVINNEIIVESFLGLIFKDEAKITDSWESFLTNSVSGKRGRVIGEDLYLEAILKLFRGIGIRHIYLLVDEIEDLRTSRLSKKAAVEYLATLRRMIQHNYKMFSFVLASTPDAWNELILYYHAIQDRFPVTIDLIGDINRTKEVIAKYLQETRPEEYVAHDRWFPFSESAIDKLIELRGISLRDILKECRRLIDYGVQHEVSPSFSSEFIEENVTVNILME